MSSDEEVDIYAFMPGIDIPDDEKTGELEKKCKELESKISGISKELEETQKLHGTLKTSFSSLLLTARAEVKRKDRQIAELRSQLDSLTFRRNKKEPPTIDSISYKNSESNIRYNNTSQPYFVPLHTVDYSVPPPPIPHHLHKTQVLSNKPAQTNYKQESLPHSDPLAQHKVSKFQEPTVIKHESESEEDNKPSANYIPTVYGERLRKKLLEEKNQNQIKNESEQNGQNVIVTNNESTGKIPFRNEAGQHTHDIPKTASDSRVEPKSQLGESVSKMNTSQTDPATKIDLTYKVTSRKDNGLNHQVKTAHPSVNINGICDSRNFERSSMHANSKQNDIGYNDQKQNTSLASKSKNSISTPIIHKNSEKKSISTKSNETPRHNLRNREKIRRPKACDEYYSQGATSTRTTRSRQSNRSQEKFDSSSIGSCSPPVTPPGLRRKSPTSNEKSRSNKDYPSNGGLSNHRDLLNKRKRPIGEDDKLSELLNVKKPREQLDSKSNEKRYPTRETIRSKRKRDSDCGNDETLNKRQNQKEIIESEKLLQTCKSNNKSEEKAQYAQESNDKTRVTSSLRDDEAFNDNSIKKSGVESTTLSKDDLRNKLICKAKTQKKVIDSPKRTGLRKSTESQRQNQEIIIIDSDGNEGAEFANSVILPKQELNKHHMSKSKENENMDSKIVAVNKSFENITVLIIGNEKENKMNEFNKESKQYEIVTNIQTSDIQNKSVEPNEQDIALKCIKEINKIDRVNQTVQSNSHASELTDNILLHSADINRNNPNVQSSIIDLNSNESVDDENNILNKSEINLLYGDLDESIPIVIINDGELGMVEEVIPTDVSNSKDEVEENMEKLFEIGPHAVVPDIANICLPQPNLESIDISKIQRIKNSNKKISIQEDYKNADNSTEKKEEIIEIQPNLQQTNNNECIPVEIPVEINNTNQDIKKSNELDLSIMNGKNKLIEIINNQSKLLQNDYPVFECENIIENTIPEQKVCNAIQDNIPKILDSNHDDETLEDGEIVESDEESLKLRISCDEDEKEIPNRKTTDEKPIFNHKRTDGRKLSKGSNDGHDKLIDIPKTSRSPVNYRKHEEHSKRFNRSGKSPIKRSRSYKNTSKTESKTSHLKTSKYKKIEPKKDHLKSKRDYKYRREKDKLDDVKTNNSKQQHSDKKERRISDSHSHIKNSKNLRSKEKDFEQGDKNKDKMIDRVNKEFEIKKNKVDAKISSSKKDDLKMVIPKIGNKVTKSDIIPKITSKVQANEIQCNRAVSVVDNVHKKTENSQKPEDKEPYLDKNFSAIKINSAKLMTSDVNQNNEGNQNQKNFTDEINKVNEPPKVVPREIPKIMMGHNVIIVPRRKRPVILSDSPPVVVVDATTSEI